MSIRALVAVALIAVAVATLPVSAAMHRTEGGPTARSAHIASVIAEAQGDPDATKASGPGYYVVQLLGEPVAAYEGGLRGYPATSPAVTGRAGVDAGGAAEQSYAELLAARQESFLWSASRTLGRPLDVLHHYRYALNGVAVWLTPAEAARLSSLPGVRRLDRATVDPLATDVGPGWIGARPIWEGTAAAGIAATRGEGIVVGIIDTGVNSDHPSFAAVGGDGYRHVNPFGSGKYVGFCDPTNPRYDPKLACNDKLVGIWSFDESLNDPEDRDGHGSHTGSTTAGNVTEAPFVAGSQAFTRTISGVAPHANVIAYDVCVPASPIWRCISTATIQAVDHAIVEQVDVLNYSIGMGQNSPWQNPIAEAFRNARKANIVVVTAAGNDGPGPATVHSVAPWALTVAAATHDRAGRNALVGMTGGSGRPPGDLAGFSYARGVGPSRIVYAKTVANAGGQLDDGTCMVRFPPDSLKGAIVVCDSNGDWSSARLDYISSNVRSGGAVGLVRVNTQAEGARMDPGSAYRFPALNLSYQDGKTLKDWLARGSGHQARIRGAEVGEWPPFGDVAAGFSSRGPSPSEDCCYRPDWPLRVAYIFDVLKPDVLAPGVDILAAVASDPNFPSGQAEFGIYGGTSMASPHVAGAAALVRAARPAWTPSEVQSALMLTAVSDAMRLEDGTTPADALVGGAGRVDAAKAVASGLLMPVTDEAYGSADPEEGGDPRDLNLASVADSRCAGKCAWTRTVRSPLASRVTWTAAAIGGAGLAVDVEPKTFTLDPGQSQVITVRADVSGVADGDWAFGDVRLTTTEPNVPGAHIPVAVRSVGVRAPLIAVVSASERTGQQSVGAFRTRGAPALQASVAGLTKATMQGMSLTEDPTPDNPFDLLGGARPFTGTMEGTLTIKVNVPSGARRLVAEIVSSEATDIDLYMGYDADRDGQAEERELASISGSPQWTEYCDVAGPRAGQWWIHVQSWKGSSAQPDDVVLSYAVVLAEGSNALAVTGPASAASGEAFDLSFRWDLPEIAKGERHFGQLLLGPDAARPTGFGAIPIDLLGPPLMTPAPPATATPVPQPTGTPVPWPTDTPMGPRVGWAYLPAAYLGYERP